MNRLAAAALALAAGLAGPRAGAQPAPSLAEAVESAWQRTPQSAEAAGQARRAGAEQVAADALWAAPPALELGAARSRQRAVGTTRETELGLAVALWLPGQRAARQGQAGAEAAAAAAHTAAARLRVAGLVREAAAEVALQQADVAAAQARARELDALASDVERRVAAGDLARADALTARAEHLGAVTALAQAGQGLHAAQRRWQALTGLPAVPEPAAADAPVAPAHEHPAVRAAAADVELARQRVGVARSARSDAPELVVTARHEATAGEPNLHGLGVALRVPFGTAARNEPLMAAALSGLELAQATRHALQQQLDAETATAQHAADSARQQARDEATRARLLRERAGLIDQSFKAGETPLPELLRAVTAAAQAEAAASRAQAALAQAASRLQQALGVMP